MTKPKTKKGSQKQLRIAILFILAVLLTSIGLFLLFPSFKADSPSIVVPAGNLGVPIPGAGAVNNLFEYISAIVSFCVFPLGLTLAVGLIIYGGYLYIFSQGDNTQMTNAKDTIFGAVWGYTLLFMVKLIMSVLGV